MYNANLLVGMYDVLSFDNIVKLRKLPRFNYFKNSPFSALVGYLLLT